MQGERLLIILALALGVELALDVDTEQEEQEEGERLRPHERIGIAPIVDVEAERTKETDLRGASTRRCEGPSVERRR